MTKFKSGGNKIGFNPSGVNDCVPNPSGPPKTKFSGRGSVPGGKLKRYPGAVANTSGGNSRLSKSSHGDGDGSGVNFSTTGGNAFGRGRK